MKRISEQMVLGARELLFVKCWDVVMRGEGWFLCSCAKWLDVWALLLWCGIGVFACVVSGCSTQGVKNPSGIPQVAVRPDESGFVAGQGVESQDLVAVTDHMVRSILLVPVVANASKPPRVLIEPIVNETRFPINKSLFLLRIRAQLNAKAYGRMEFLAREMVNKIVEEAKLRGRVEEKMKEGNLISELGIADYFLTGRLHGVSSRTSQGLSDYIYYAFQLIDAKTSIIVWEDSAEIKKQGLEEAIYR